MSEHKISGACTLCDDPCFEVLQVWGGNERYPGEPKRLGEVIENAVRITFLLLDGTKADMTFCGECAESLTPDRYVEIWRKVIRSWQRELDKDHPGEPKPQWYDRQFQNAIAVEIVRTQWRNYHG